MKKNLENKKLTKNLSNIEIKQIFGDDNLLKELFKNAIYAVNPSRYEGFSLPNLEAISIRCYFVCPHISIFREI